MTAWTSDERLALLSRTEIFDGADPEGLRLFAEMLRPEAYGAGETVCAPGEVARDVWIVAEGRLAVRDGAGNTLRTLAPGAVLGEYGLFAGGVRTARLVAETPVELLAVGYEPFREFLLREPRATLALLRVAVQRLVDAERRAAGAGPAGGAR
jgi:CRP-like cAMP-binding protein